MTSVVQITDCHLLDEPGELFRGVNPDQQLFQVLELSRAFNPGLIVASGDLTEDGAASAYRRLQKLLERAPAPVVCLPGNHDNLERMQRLLPGDRISLQSACSLDGWRLCFLDSTVTGEPYGRLDADQLQSLDDDFKRHPQACKLVFVHHQPVPTESPWIDAMRLTNGPDLLQVMSRDARAKGVAFGHIHHVFETECHGIRVMSAPATSFQVVPRQQTMQLDTSNGPGLRWFTLHANGGWETGVERLKSTT